MSNSWMYRSHSSRCGRPAWQGQPRCSCAEYDGRVTLVRQACACKWPTPHRRRSHRVPSSACTATLQHPAAKRRIRGCVQSNPATNKPSSQARRTPPRPTHRWCLRAQGIGRRGSREGLQAPAPSLLPFAAAWREAHPLPAATRPQRRRQRQRRQWRRQRPAGSCEPWDRLSWQPDALHLPSVCLLAQLRPWLQQSGWSAWLRAGCRSVAAAAGLREF